MNEELITKKNHFFSKFLFLLFFVFICLYVIKENGYLAHKMSNITFNTETQIKEFEKNINSEIKEDGYINKKNNNYANNMSKFGEKVSDTISFVAEKSFSLLSNFFKYLFG